MPTVAEMVDAFIQVSEESASELLTLYERKLFEKLEEKKLKPDDWIITHWREMIDELNKRLYGFVPTQTQ